MSESKQVLRSLRDVGKYIVSPVILAAPISHACFPTEPCMHQIPIGYYSPDTRSLVALATDDAGHE